MSLGASMTAALLATRHRRAAPEPDGDDWGDEPPPMDERRAIWRYMPVTVVLFLCAQTGTAIWWASSITGAQQSTARQIDKLESVIYTKSEAALAQQLSMQRNAECERRLVELERKIFEHVRDNGGKSGP